MQKWEYCVFKGIDDKLNGVRPPGQERYLATTETGREVDEPFMLEGRVVFANPQDGFGPTRLAFKKLAQMGEEGWELVAIDGPNFWFKRPKA